MPTPRRPSFETILSNFQRMVEQWRPPSLAELLAVRDLVIQLRANLYAGRLYSRREDWSRV